MGDKEIPVETFDALLRDLATWNLVVPVDVEGDEAETWQLVPRARTSPGRADQGPRTLAGRAHGLPGPPLRRLRTKRADLDATRHLSVRHVLAAPTRQHRRRAAHAGTRFRQAPPLGCAVIASK